MLVKLLDEFIKSFLKAISRTYFGFIQGHGYLSLSDIEKIQLLVGVNSVEEVATFERKFAGLIGCGECVAYAAARMGFYDLMRVLNIGKGDEVILLGSTCAVMVNAVMRTGATPVFSDMDLETYGSSSCYI